MQAEVITRQIAPEDKQMFSSLKPVFNRGTAFLKIDHQKWVKIDFNDVVYIEAREKISVIFFADGKFMVCKSPLYKVQCLLPLNFERIHRAYIVNVNWVSYVDLYNKQVGLKNDEVLALGFAYKDCIAKYFVNPSRYNQ